MLVDTYLVRHGFRLPAIGNVNLAVSTLQVIVHKFDLSKTFRSFTVKLQITILFLAQRHLNIPLTGFGFLADYVHARCRIFFRCYRGFPWVLCQCCQTLCRYNRWSFRRNRCRTDVRRHRWRNTSIFGSNPTRTATAMIAAITFS